jgi:hypothetical protein
LAVHFCDNEVHGIDVGCHLLGRKEARKGTPVRQAPLPDEDRFDACAHDPLSVILSFEFVNVF